MKNLIQSKKAMAIPIVFAFIGILSITVVSMLRSTKDDLPVVFHNVKHLQMKYLAKGAMQHARLKLKLLSTEAYDAAAYAVGKNPYYDHSAGYDFTALTTKLNVGQASQREAVPGSGIVTNPGPAFITGTINVDGSSRADVHDINFNGIEGTDTWSAADLTGFDIQTRALFGFDSGTGYYESGESTDAIFKTNLALVRFYEGISTVSPERVAGLQAFNQLVDQREWIDNGNLSLTAPPSLALTVDEEKTVGVFPYSQAAIRVLSGVVDPVTGVPDMFSARYFVKEMKVLATQGNRLYGQEALKVKVHVDLYTRGAAGTTKGTIGATTGAGETRLGATTFKAVTGFLEETSVFKVARTIN
ncbi:MAG: hypothetical protein KC646_15260 [Candidatus Cloacimonetes bacterium]|nr:hypothetical protein [Candidatus Cloacimonadota bacterium]